MSFSKDILKGFVDIHVHAGPSVAARKVDAYDMMELAGEAGYRAFLVKDHYFPTMMGTRMISEHFSKNGCQCFGGLALNRSVGLFNVHAVDAACNMGAKTIYMPTVSCVNHIAGHSGGHKFVGSGNSSVVDGRSQDVEDQAQLHPGAVEVISYIASKHPEVVLCTGHGNAREVDAVVRKAVELGVPKICVNHPHFLVNATYEQMKEWSDLGAYIELNAAVFSTIAKSGTCPDEVAGKILETIPTEKIVLDSDLGQKVNVDPVTGMLQFINLLADQFGVTEEQINLMGKQTPAMLLGLD